MAKYSINDSTLTAIGDAVRTKTGGTARLTPEGMASALNGITERSSSDLTASGATVSVPAGNYKSAASKSVATATQATPSISVASNGLITSSATQTAGYVSAGTKSATKQLATKATATITPTSSKQTAVAAGVFTTGAIYVGAIPSDYQNINTLTTQLCNSLQYSGLVNSSMSFSAICDALAAAFPSSIDFLKIPTGQWSVSPSMSQLITPVVASDSSSIAFTTYKMNAASGYVDFLSPVFEANANSVFNYAGSIYSHSNNKYKGHIYVLVGGTYKEIASYSGRSNFNNSVSLSSYAGKSCQIVIREYCGWDYSNDDYTKMTFTTLKIAR